MGEEEESSWWPSVSGPKQINPDNQFIDEAPSKKNIIKPETSWLFLVFGVLVFVSIYFVVYQWYFPWPISGMQW